MNSKKFRDKYSRGKKNDFFSQIHFSGKSNFFIFLSFLRFFNLRLELAGDHVKAIFGVVGEGYQKSKKRFDFFGDAICYF